ncbi:MAG: DUF3373 domain-containing protein [Deltaproteobacteria bacterium]|nr:DUF3373 domain-containing protein [Deltaproteobacteria bacterium]
MKRFIRNAAAASLLLGMALPVSAMAADQDLDQKVDSLAKEVEGIKRDAAQAKRKSLGQWLEIGGDYRFRMDGLWGQTAAFTDVTKTFANTEQTLQSNFFNSAPVPPGFPSWQNQIGGLMNFSNNMKQVSSFSGAQTFLANNQQMLQGIGNFAVQVPAYKPENETLNTNRFGINLHAKPIQDVTVNARLVGYKTFGSQDDSAFSNNGNTAFFGDRVGVFDGSIGHVPTSSLLDIDRAYATWSNVLGQPLWFSLGRRPSNNGIPSNLRLNNERPGNAGTPAMMIDYAFDGGTIGWAPDIDALPGAYAKICYGRGFESGFSSPTNSLKDTEFLGIAVIPVDTDPLRVWLQWNKGWNVFDFPVMKNTAFGDTAPAVELGSIEQWGAGSMSTLKNVGPGSLNFFAETGLSITHPNDNVSANAGFQGLLTGTFFNPEAPSDKTGWSVNLGTRYDYTPTATKFGFEFNHGSKNWITFAPAADDLWTSKLGTRGNVYEGYIIQELKLQPISSYTSKVFFRLGYQYYDFEYTNSNNWVGAPVKIADIKPTDMMLLTPVKTAQDLYATFEVHF